MKNLNRTNYPRECEKIRRKSAIKESTCIKLALTGLLVFGVGFSISVMVSPVMAAPPACDSGEISKRCQNDDSRLVAKFCLGITNQDPGLEGDGSDSDGGLYCDNNKTDKILVFTGRGPGFRFDTKQGKGKSVAARFVQINFPGGDITVNDADTNPHTYASGLYEIDFRFDLSGGGLELGALAIDGSGEVPIGIRIKTMDGLELGLLGYGDAPQLFSDPTLIGNQCMLNNTENAVVTRTHADAWTIESNSGNPAACLWVGHANFNGQPGEVVDMPFFFTIVIDDS